MSDKFQALYKAQIEALAAIVNVHTPDHLYGRDAIPRDPVMEQVQKIRAALDMFSKESKLAQPDAQPVANEPLVRYCPGCGLVGAVDGKYRDCCPDGNEARLIPESLAKKCHDTFKMAINAICATPQPAAAPNATAAKDMHANGTPMGDTLYNAVHRVYFRAGLLACREQMARFAEAQSPSIAGSIRANWWPELGADPGAPRLLDFSELADGGEEGPWTAKDICPSVEALPIAAQFLAAP